MGYGLLIVEQVRLPPSRRACFAVRIARASLDKNATTLECLAGLDRLDALQIAALYYKEGKYGPAASVVIRGLDSRCLALPPPPALAP
jgi:hypothetical protein